MRSLGDAQLHNCTLAHLHNHNLYTCTLVHWLTALAFFLPRELLQKGVSDICTDAMCKMDGTWVFKLGEVCTASVHAPSQISKLKRKLVGQLGNLTSRHPVG